MAIELTTKEQWDSTWKKWYARYSVGSPRFGKWLRATFNLDGLDVLEIAAGSARESRAIADVCRSVTCTDFAHHAAHAVMANAPPPNLQMCQMDAFHLGFADKSFDLSFHKGFWVLFERDDDLKRLFREQLRVTRKLALIAVHNARNLRMRQDFTIRAEDDDLFRVRFFDPFLLRKTLEDELKVAGMSGSVRIHKFAALNWLSAAGIVSVADELRDRVAPVLMRGLPWSRVELSVVAVDLRP